MREFQYIGRRTFFTVFDIFLYLLFNPQQAEPRTENHRTYHILIRIHRTGNLFPVTPGVGGKTAVLAFTVIGFAPVIFFRLSLAGTDKPGITFININRIMITADHFQVSDLFKGGEILAEAIFQGVAVKLALRKLLQHGVHHPGLTNADSRVNEVFRVID